MHAFMQWLYAAGEVEHETKDHFLIQNLQKRKGITA